MSAVMNRVRRPGGRGDDLVLDAPGAERRKVRTAQLAVSAAVLIGSVLLGWLLVQSQSNVTEVWVARDRLDPGQVLELTDVELRQVDAGSTLSALGADWPAVGSVVRVPVPAGAALVEGHFFGSEDGLATVGAAQMSLVFGVGRMTDSVQRNDLIRIAVVPNGGGDLRIFDEVPVIWVSKGDRSDFLVSIEVDVETADGLVSALSEGEAWASVVGRR